MAKKHDAIAADVIAVCGPVTISMAENGEEDLILIVEDDETETKVFLSGDDRLKVALALLGWQQ